MLSDVKFVTEEPLLQADEHHLEAESLSPLATGLELATQLNYDFKGKKLIVRGIPEDYKIFLDDKLVCEIVYDTAYNVNRKLVDEILG